MAHSAIRPLLLYTAARKNKHVSGPREMTDISTRVRLWKDVAPAFRRLEGEVQYARHGFVLYVFPAWRTQSMLLCPPHCVLPPGAATERAFLLRKCSSPTAPQNTSNTRGGRSRTLFRGAERVHVPQYQSWDPSVRYHSVRGLYINNSIHYTNRLQPAAHGFLHYRNPDWTSWQQLCDREVVQPMTASADFHPQRSQLPVHGIPHM